MVLETNCAGWRLTKFPLFKNCQVSEAVTALRRGEGGNYDITKTHEFISDWNEVYILDEDKWGLICLGGH